MKRRIVLGFLALCCLPLTALADLTGRWHSDDGGDYYLRQIEQDIYWYGRSGDGRWATVFTGQFVGGELRGRWLSVPQGQATGQGELHLAVREQGKVLEVVRKVGALNLGLLMREGYQLPKPTVQEECIEFDPDKLQLSTKDKKFFIAEDDFWLFDFGDKELEAEKALRIIRHYGMNQSCFIGKPEPRFSYLLVNGWVPLGDIHDEDCIRFKPSAVVLEQNQGKWQITTDHIVLFDFGEKQGEGRSAMALIKKHQFTHACYIGRPGPSFIYMRR